MDIDLNILFEKGGIATYLIFASAFFTILIGAERLTTLYGALSKNAEDELEKIRQYIISHRYSDAMQVCNKKRSNLQLSLVKRGLIAAENGREALKASLGAAVNDITHRCEKRISYLALAANVATLFGLLGTITGLMKTFKSLSLADESKKGELLGLGISEAMLATAAGLIVGVLAMILHSVCQSKAEEIISQSQDTSYNLLTWIEQSEKVEPPKL